MTKKHPVRPRAALLIGAALLATPAFAQEAPTQTVTPPPIAATAEPAPAPAPRIEMAPSAPIVQPAPPPGPRPETATEAAPRAVHSATRSTQTRQTARTAAPARQAAPAPVAEPAAPAPVAQSPAPVAETPVQTAAAPAPAPVAPAPAAETTTTQTVTSNGSSLPWLLGGLLLVLAGAAAFLLMRRRSDETDEVEPVYEEPVAPRVYEAPVAAAPVVEPRRTPEVSPFMAATAAAAIAPAAIPSAAEEIAEAHVEAELAEPETEDLAGVTDAPAPVANRPWLEFGLRPVRAGTSEEEALVDVELTVGNSGDVPARNVRISTFMLADADGGEMESLLTGRVTDTAVPPVTIEPGDGTRVDAHLAVPKGEMGRVFNPVVIAEARYTLADGREGRTSAMFKIGRPSAVSEGVGPIGATRPHMVDDVEAELLGAPEHA
ncbi:hypothetical protein E5A73_09245 [Sphingomonas gei]|uniref:LPXTG cell wall anchor domain-containing protein n=1 Tax=Sphingomonas gei TaxID=1395960 RepID=A0A4S1XDX0_9SPHN|nr:hypothetical protein [Sphingomonas gei]TGX54281.1 hypothetical protein E5A73_09245 [Sphingomonas gei]